MGVCLYLGWDIYTRAAPRLDFFARAMERDTVVTEGKVIFE